MCVVEWVGRSVGRLRFFFSLPPLGFCLPTTTHSKKKIPPLSFLYLQEHGARSSGVKLGHDVCGRFCLRRRDLAPPSNGSKHDQVSLYQLIIIEGRTVSGARIPAPPVPHLRGNPK